MNALIKFVAGVAAVSAAGYVLRKSGADKKVISGIQKTGAAVGDVAKGAADLATNAACLTAFSVVEGGNVIAETAITATTAAATVACAGVEATGYGIGRGARFVLDASSKAGQKVSLDNPLSRGVMAGFYAADCVTVEAVAVA